MTKQNTRKILKDFVYFRTIMQQNHMLATHTTRSYTHFLISLDVFPNSTASFIQKQINLKQSSFSSLSKELESKGYIKYTVNPQDSRSKCLVLTSKGRERVKQVDAELAVQFQQRKKNVSKAELDRLTEIFNRFADYFEMPPEQPRSTEEPIRAAHRRFVRSFGITNTTFANFDISTTTWHLLFLLEYLLDELTIKDLSQKLVLSHKTVSAQIQNLLKKGHIKKVEHESDARSSVIELTALGRKQFRIYEDSIINILEKTLSAEMLELIEELNGILSRFYHIYNDLPEPFVAKRFSRPQNLQLARTFLVENLVRQNHHSFTPELLASANQHKVYALYRHKELVAVAQFYISEELTLDCCAWSPDLKEVDLKYFIDYLLSARRRSKPRSVTFKPLLKILKSK